MEVGRCTPPVWRCLESSDKELMRIRPLDILRIRAFNNTSTLKISLHEICPPPLYLKSTICKVYFQQVVNMSEKPMTRNGLSREETREEALDQVRSAGFLTLSPELFEKLYLQPQTAVKGDLRKILGNPTPL
jgi:hypothetical protein